jgi:molybdate/tungstate transport system permease protein
MIFLAYVLFPIFGIFLRIGILNQEDLAPLMNPKITSSMLLSLQTATASTVICTIMGVPLAFLIARCESRFTPILRIAIAMPLAIPPLIAGALLVNVYGEASTLGMQAEHLGIKLTQSPIGIILAQVFVISPFVVLTASAGIQRVDKHYEYASRILGKNAALTFFSITLPLASRELAAGIILAWIRAIGEFGANVMMAYNPKTISIQLWEYNALGGLKLVMPGVLLVIVFSFVSLLFLFWVIDNGRKKNTSRIGLGVHYNDD